MERPAVQRLPKAAQPNKTFYTPASWPRRTVRLHPDAAHTDGDMYVHFPDQNVLAVGDMLSGQGWPVVDWATGGWIGGMVGGHRRLLTLVNARPASCPARGPVLSLADLKTQHRDVCDDL